jgi:2-polyprenyl-3-methyl-5-hydroxy-6-metoxy-1,4-benzoquinol methylase
MSKLYDSSPQELVQYAAHMATNLFKRSTKPHDEITGLLQRKFGVYTTSNLKGVTAEEFKRSIQSRIGTVDAEIEGYREGEIEQQRDLSIKFHWGHNHDFGDFRLEGRMGNRHINLLADFLSLFPLSLDDIQGKHVLDVGCWTGGTTLLLATIAKSVLAIEEAKKYAETVSFLSRSFGVDDRVSVKPLSIYECNAPEFFDQFDVVYFPGVIYHLSDPLLALRILFNSLKEGGFILVESAGINSQKPICQFDGSLVWHSGERERMNRGGWNWFSPSPSALFRMMREAGFDEVQTRWHYGTKRVYGLGRKVSQIGICKAGLSVPSIR